MTSTDHFRLLIGRDAAPDEMRQLRAGPLNVLLDGIDLRYARIGGVELVRRVYVAVRDESWNTISGEVSDLEVDAGDDSFEVRFAVRHTNPDVDFSWQGRIAGAPSGKIEYALDGKAEADMRYNRIGICVHHPWRETAGRPFRARTPDGEITGSFPSLIGPQAFEDGVYLALFPAFDRLDFAMAGGGSLRFDFEGDLWETEDHRNWTDGNYKTYSTPLGLGFPHELKAGEALGQKVTLTPRGLGGGDAEQGPVSLTVGAPTGTKVPAIGLGTASHGEPLSDREAAQIAALGPAHLAVDVRLDRDDWQEALAAAQLAASRVGARLEVSLHLRPEHADKLAAVGDALAGGPPVDRVLVIIAGGRTSTPEETTPPELVGLVRAALTHVLPGAIFGGGTNMYFTEINRTRPQAETWDAVCFSITPQIHAFTDVDIVENLDAQGENVKSAVALAGGKQVVVSPITIKRRANFHSADPDAIPPVPEGEVPDAVDVRQPSLIGGAWTAGSLKYVSETGATSVTYYETSGWRGVVERDDGPPMPEKFFSQPGQVFPLYHPLADVADWRGAEVLDCASTDPLAAVGLAVRTDDGALRLLVANVTAEPQVVLVSQLDKNVLLRRLNEETAERAAFEPEAFRGDSEPAEASAGELSLELAPYEVVRIDPA